MNAAIIAIVYIGCALVAPAYSINCTTCNNCTASSAFSQSTQCSSTDSCVKIDFNDNGIFKACGSYSELCSESGFRANWANLYNDMKAAFGQSYVDNALKANWNDRGRYVISCCNDRDYCNGALSMALNIAAALGMMVMLYVVI